MATPVLSKLALKGNNTSYKRERSYDNNYPSVNKKKQVPFVLSISTFHYPTLPYFNANP
jgi:hypothetical protein